MTWQAITFVTRGTGYEREVLRLKASCEACKVPLRIYFFDNLGSWRANLNYKSQCIMDAMAEFPGKDIVFIDADAVVRSYPTAFDQLSAVGEYDIAVHYLRNVELLSGTLWIANTADGFNLVKRWHEVALQHPEWRHQVCLQKIVGAFKIYRLPIEYTCIFDHPLRRGKVAVIEHFQASRRYRRRLSPSVRRPSGSPFFAGATR